MNSKNKIKDKIFILFNCSPDKMFTKAIIAEHLQTYHLFLLIVRFVTAGFSFSMLHKKLLQLPRHHFVQSRLSLDEFFILCLNIINIF